MKKQENPLNEDQTELFDTGTKKIIKGRKFNPEFKALDKRYKIIVPAEDIPIERNTAFLAMDTMFTFGMSVSQIANYIVQHKALLDKAILGGQGVSFADVIKHNLDFLNTLKDTAKNKYGKEFWICTIFIIEQGENWNDYSIEHGLEKIETWAKAGYSAADFRTLAHFFTNKYNKVLEKLEKRAKSARLSPNK